MDDQDARPAKTTRPFTPGWWLAGSFVCGAIALPLGVLTLIFFILMPVVLIFLLIFIVQLVRSHGRLSAARVAAQTSGRKLPGLALWNVLQFLSLAAGGLLGWPLWLAFFQSLDLGSAFA